MDDKTKRLFSISCMAIVALSILMMATPAMADDRCPKPDLTIIKKSEALDGDTLSVTYTIKNIGDGDAGASTTCIYADGALLTTDKVRKLKADKSCTSTVTIDPFKCPCGTTVTIKVCADNDDDVEESNKRNNCLENKLKCPECPCEKPDLTIIKKSEELDGNTLSVTYTIKNIGKVAACASTTCIYADGALLTTDTVGTLEAGESYTSTVTIDPFDCRCGTTVTIKVCADNDDDVEESNERNNCLENKLKCPECPCEKPDLTIIEKSEVLDGNTLSVTYTIKNIGKVAACASTTCIYADGALLTTDTVGTLEAGESYTSTVTIDPFKCPCGTTVTIKVCADNDDVVDESNERNNNCLENKLKCPECPCEKPDLTILTKSEAWVSLDDKTYTITYTVKNNGDGDAAASTTAIMINGVEVATDPVPELASGESYSNTLGPFTMQGYCDTIVVCADSDDAVVESNEGNNCRRNTFCRPGPVTSADVPALTPFGAAILIGSLSIFAVANMRRRDE
nr:conserved hypothetical protein [uncultured archaeon GZfos11A10]